MRAGRFTKVFRLGRDRDFKHVFSVRHRRESGPLLVYGAPNDLGHARLGLSVSRKVGGAIARNRVKRHLRESFRQSDGKNAAFDFVVVVRPHGEMKADAYQRHLDCVMQKVTDGWTGPPASQHAD